MKKLLCVLLVMVIFVPSALAGDGVTLLSVYKSDWTDQVEVVTVTNDRFASRYDLTGVEFDPTNPESVLSALVDSKWRASEKGDPTLTNALYEVVNRYNPKNTPMINCGIAANDAGTLYRYATRKTGEIGSAEWVPLSISGDIVMQNFDWDAVKLDQALSQLMPASDFFGSDDLSPTAAWPIEFAYSYGSFNGGVYDYSLKLADDGRLRFTAMGSNGINLSIDRNIDADVMAHAAQAILENKLDDWNGFSERDGEILDGYGFELRYKLRKRDEVRASGYERYPENYEQAHAQLLKFFDRLVKVYG